MKLVLNTETIENRAAWYWDGKGGCPQNWKFSKGTTYVIEDVYQYIDICHPYMELLDLIEYDNDRYRESITECMEIEDSETSWPSYIIPTVLTRNGYGLWIASRINHEGQTESWIMKRAGESEDYRIDSDEFNGLTSSWM